MNKAALQSFCSVDSLNNLTLFNNFDEKTYFGQYGNANYYFIKDWIQMNIATANSGFNITWDENTSNLTLTLEKNL